MGYDLWFRLLRGGRPLSRNASAHLPMKGLPAYFQQARVGDVLHERGAPKL